MLAITAAAVVGAAVVVDTTVVVDACVVSRATVVAGVAVSELPLHPEATNKNVRTTAYFLTVSVCHPAPEGAVGVSDALGVDTYRRFMGLRGGTRMAHRHCHRLDGPRRRNTGSKGQTNPLRLNR